MSDFQDLQRTILALNMSKEQIQSLIETLQTKEINRGSGKTYALAEEEEQFFRKCSDNRNGEIRACPKCGSISTIKYGAIKGRQRYFCKDCKRTFGDTFGTAMFHSKLSLDKWKKLLELILRGTSCREIALDLHINKDTALYNRHRICSILLQLVNNTDDFPSVAEGDEYYLPLSFKDKKDPEFFIEELGRMPYTHRSREDRCKYCESLGYTADFIARLDKNEKDCNEELLQFFSEDDLQSPTKLSLALNKMEQEKIFQVLKTLDTQQKKKRGISNQQVCVLSCVDVAQNHFLKPVCVGRVEPRHIEENLVPHLTKDTILVTDSHRAYKTIANKHKIPLRQIPSGKHTSNGFSLGHINGYHKNISDFFKGYIEVASKYIDHYLALFYWEEKHKKIETKDKVTMLLDLLTYQAERTNLHDFKYKPIPIDMKGII